MCFARSRAKAGWFIVATDSAVFDRIVVQLDSLQPGRTYEIPSECAVYHDRFVPLRGPMGSSSQDHCRGSVTVLETSDDAIRARLDIAVEPHHSMHSSLQMSQEVTFVRGASEFGMSVAFADEVEAECPELLAPSEAVPSSPSEVQ
ncbi:MAG: hypothetical protein RBS80_21110 [Thermoguttaceae bacterium]|nr:hypothetical protein [Thermoguttaceae bacterium]